MKLAPTLVLPPTIESPRYFSWRSPTEVFHGGNLPHWEQSCATAFVTFRLSDSLPHERLVCWRAEKEAWLAKHPFPWNEATQREYDVRFAAQVEKWLDQGIGSCALASPQARGIVEAVLRHFDGIRYRLYAFVVMPNHVHAVFMPYEGHSVSAIVQAWKSVSAHALKKQGCPLKVVWQRESFDRYIRDGAHFDRAMRYTKRNDESRSWWVCEE